ncbi:MFS transporter [Tengunoibacter tsumagoiensis]|uniref:MFS transporter n=1 Tax=Tengunoibacter tsumagoiensis TaxID=2014871 RepID=A0A402A6C8_9CHLR|nr:MFS transporter [Tengunoibacter tsumagoiensis]GCE14586.1 MFS transporter [Tengunoibacter tsumagoiensis]
MNPRIYLLALGTFALGTDLFVIAGVLPAIAHQYAVSIDSTGLLITVFSLMYGFCAPVLAAFTNRVPRQTLLMVVLAGFGLANVLSALAPTFPILLLTRIIAAGFAALYTPTAAVVAASLAAPERRGQALAIVLGGLTTATILGVPLGSWLGQHFGWQATFLLVAALGCLAFLALLAFRLPHIANPPAVSLKARLAPLLKPELLLALIPIAFWSFGGFTTYTYIAPFLSSYTHITDPSLMLLIYGAGGVLGSWLGGYLVDRFGAARPIIIGLFILIIVYATLPFTATTLIGAMLALAIWGTCGNLLFAPQQHRLLSLSPTLPTIMLALNSSALYLGIASGSALGSIILMHSSIGTLAPASAFLTIVALILFASSLWFSGHRAAQASLII